MFANTGALKYIDLTFEQPKFVYNLDLIDLVDLTEEESIDVPAPAPADPEPDLCPLCIEQEVDTEFPDCKHKFCLTCTLGWIFTPSSNSISKFNCKTVSCPTCRNAQAYKFNREGDLQFLQPKDLTSEESDPDGLFDSDFEEEVQRIVPPTDSDYWDV